MALAFEEMNVGTTEEPRPLSITKDLLPSDKMTMIELLSKCKDVFAWSHEDMKGLDPKPKPTPNQPLDEREASPTTLI